MKQLKSPLRYPGGKAKLYSIVQEIISQNTNGEICYYEPFAGGCGLALKLLGNEDVSTIHINDCDFAIYSFWTSVLNETDRFCEKINNLEINISEWKLQKDIYLNKERHDIFDIGFATFFLNRTNVSGIIKGGVMGGYNQSGKYKIDCRFNKKQLIKQIWDIAEYKDRIYVTNYNVFDLFKNDSFNIDNIFIYFDPPYVKKGSQLYRNSFNNDDHILLSDMIKNLKEKFIVTYDNQELIKDLYKDLSYNLIDIKYSAGTKREAEEILILSEKITYDFN
ncbi:DNA adenine methylase [Mammaliicoccus sciuri]|uniref:site-specific DNA-methyltransferase (adenine-specific) n=1 Tax=Mammaliicoccus sciuri TaxID=1296 RepID=A0AAJ4SK16_MAMSC|nr:DNA adenine methylase [Mammaliicoccus sciuri]RTX75015.1 DNA adenine methylase [Mammaliicoccus sciuri]